MLVWGVNKFLKKGMGLEIGVLILVQKGHTLETLKIGYYRNLGIYSLKCISYILIDKE